MYISHIALYPDLHAAWNMQNSTCASAEDLHDCVLCNRAQEQNVSIIINSVHLVYTKIYKVCHLHNNILYLKNKEDTTVSTFAFIMLLETPHVSTLILGHHQAYSAPV
jgi:hypothetical protein